MKSISFDLFSIKWSTLVKDWKCQFISKKLMYFDFFDHFQYNLISFRLKSIDFELFNLFLSSWNQFRHNNSNSGDKFRSKKLIKSRFDHDISQFGDLDWLHCLSIWRRHIIFLNTNLKYSEMIFLYYILCYEFLTINLSKRGVNKQ